MPSLTSLQHPDVYIFVKPTWHVNMQYIILYKFHLDRLWFHLQRRVANISELVTMLLRMTFKWLSYDIIKRSSIFYSLRDGLWEKSIRSQENQQCSYVILDFNFCKTNNFTTLQALNWTTLVVFWVQKQFFLVESS